MACAGRKRARTFLGLAAACVPVQFSQLGAMVYSLVSHNRTALPGVMIYQANGWGQILLNGVITLLLLSPVVFLGMSALIRAKAKPATLAYLVACAALVVPVRAGLGLAMVLTALAVFLWWMDSRYIVESSTAATREGIVSRLMVTIPVVILIGRAWFYPMDTLFVGVLLMVTGTLSFEVFSRGWPQERVSRLFQDLSTLPILAGWILLAFKFLSMGQFTLLGTFLPLAGILTLLSFRTIDGGKRYRTMAAAVALSTLVLNLSVNPSLVASFLCVGISTLMVVAGYSHQEKVMFGAGGAGFLIGMGYHLRFAVDWYQASPWAFLAVAGLAILAASSYVEKHAKRVLGRLIQFREQVKAWS